MPRQSRQQRTATLPMGVKLGSRGTQLGSPVFPCNRTSSGPVRMSQMCQYRKSTKSFDQFVGACEQRRRGGNAECFGGLHVDYKLECRNLLHR